MSEVLAINVKKFRSLQGEAKVKENGHQAKVGDFFALNRRPGPGAPTRAGLMN
jgi:hypothetical protein